MKAKCFHVQMTFLLCNLREYFIAKKRSFYLYAITVHFYLSCCQLLNANA